MTPLAWVAFVTAAGVAAALRYLVDGYVQDRTAGPLPWGTFVVNASGSLLFGVLTGVALTHRLPDTLHLVLGTGFCGAYTTFSTFTVETVRLLEEGAIATAARYAGVTVVACATGSAAGLAIALLSAP